MVDDNLELIESMCKILNKHELDSLEYCGIKIMKSKHKLVISKPYVKKDKKQEKLKSELEVTPEDETFFTNPFLYLAVE